MVRVRQHRRNGRTETKRLSITSTAQLCARGSSIPVSAGTVSIANGMRHAVEENLAGLSTNRKFRSFRPGWTAKHSQRSGPARGRLLARSVPPKHPTTTVACAPCRGHEGDGVESYQLVTGKSSPGGCRGRGSATRGSKALQTRSFPPSINPPIHAQTRYLWKHSAGLAATHRVCRGKRLQGSSFLRGGRYGQSQAGPCGQARPSESGSRTSPESAGVV